MRKAQKQQIEELIGQMEEAQDQIRKYMEQNNVSSAMELLGDCQSGGIAIGTQIDDAEGEGHPTVSLLEEYCELVYQIYEGLANDSHETDAGKVCKLLRQKLIRIRNSIKNDIPVKKEVVFLPYKASMWDSLESVWKAAEEDENCDAYVIPISYFDKNPDGSFREMHYEADQYPDYVPVVSYGKYDFEARRPDVIYIHNPYDEYNYVTSVPPFFFSGNLKKMTEKLVYIPYFVLDEIRPDEEERIEGIKHFCTVPAVYNADKVIVQSENMRQVYIKVLLEASNDHSKAARKYWEHKILGLGSPKFDKVLNTRKENLEIPGEWLKVIEKPDGSWKKIVFYNTGVTALLQYEEKMLEKMESVFEIFYKNRDKVVLLWRPHPLTESTLMSMRPQFVQKYRLLRDKYVQEKWGIYDDTADIDRAIMLSDGYYGDASSVVQLYQKTGKALMLQSVSALEYITKPDIVDAVKIDNEIWFYLFGKLCVADRRGKVNKYYDVPHTIDQFKSDGFESIVYLNRKIYLVPFMENQILQFEMSTEKFTFIKISQELIQGKKWLFISAKKYNRYLFIIGANIPVIIRLDSADNSLEYIIGWTKDIESYGKGYYFWKQNLLLGHKLFLPFNSINAVLELDCETLETAIHKIETKKEGYSGICYSDKNIWIVSRESAILTKWNIHTGELLKISISNGRKKQKFYSGIVNQKNKKFLLPRTTEKSGYRNEKENIYELTGNYSFVHEDDDGLIFYENISGIFSIYEEKANVFEKIELVTDKDFWKSLGLERMFCNGQKVLSERRGISVLRLIDFLTDY